MFLHMFVKSAKSSVAAYIINAHRTRKTEKCTSFFCSLLICHKHLDHPICYEDNGSNRRENTDSYMIAVKVEVVDLCLLGWRVISWQYPPKHCINPPRVFMDAQTSQRMLKKMSHS